VTASPYDALYPYTLNGREHRYSPDFVAVIDDGHGQDDLVNLIIEVTGERKKERPPRSPLP
jgi:type III restriction enzyme